MAERSIDVLLVGGGIASASAAAELREQGFDGTIVLASREQDPPYHRPPITKGYLQGRETREQALVHPAEWYEQNGVGLLTRTSVMALDPVTRTAKLGKQEVAFDRALLATGAMARRLDAEGAHLEGIHYLRALGNADALRRGAERAERIAIVGGSYVATEVAASLAARGRPCTLIMQEQTTLERSFGRTVGRFAQDLLETHGVEVLGGQSVVRFEGEGQNEEARVAGVVTDTGQRVPADLVVIGVGAVPDVMLARRSGLDLGASGGVLCDAQLRTSVPKLFAAGDMCEYDSRLHGRRMRIEHEEVAAAQGRTAARNMLGAEEAFEEVPYFWSDLADWATLEYVGPAAEWDEEIVCGQPADGRFTVWYLERGRLVAALALGHPEHLDLARSLLRRRTDLAPHRRALADADGVLDTLAETMAVR
ncbi:MAG TPA: FAD-dependent oxidoreductase [Solirubrobacteraceae bacterium]|nr:FAD-dependent oxidoreductase [Solirubrobacteraceae bacterium]